MPSPPSSPEAMVFIDGQNLYHAAKIAFGYTYPNSDVCALSKEICREHDWSLKQVRYYTGVPDASDHFQWNRFWAAKLLAMSRQGVVTFSRPLRYRNKVFRSPDGREFTSLIGEEKGIDVRIAIDIIRMAHRREYDVALILSQDQDLSEVAEELRTISHEQDRWLKAASAYPVSPTYRNKRGILKTDWIRLDRALYDRCIDPRDYRPKRKDR